MTLDLDRAAHSLDMRERFADTSIELVESDPRVAVVLAEISRQYFDGAMRRYPDRIINVGIREPLAVNVGAGMALAGMRPIVHTFASFLVERSFEQIKLGFSHQNVGGVLVSSGASYDISSGGRTHQSPGDVALLATLPDWEIHVPGHADEAASLIRQAVAGEGRAYVRLSGHRNRDPHPTGPMTVLRRGGRGTVIAVGRRRRPWLRSRSPACLPPADGNGRMAWAAPGCSARLTLPGPARGGRS